MKIIELLNRIANGEEVPKKIKYEYDYYELKEKYNEDWEQWEYGYQAHTGGYLNIWRKDVLNDEVEIIEEPQEHKIEKLKKEKVISGDIDGKTFYDYRYNEDEIGNKLNEIIDYLKENK